MGRKLPRGRCPALQLAGDCLQPPQAAHETLSGAHRRHRANGRVRGAEGILGTETTEANASSPTTKKTGYRTQATCLFFSMLEGKTHLVALGFRGSVDPSRSAISTSLP